MNFTDTEKDAIVWCMFYLADSDGKRNLEEVNILAEIAKNIGLKISVDNLWRITEIDQANIYATLRTFNPDKKEFLRNTLRKVAIVDGDINDLEAKALYHIGYFGKIINI
jgi:tellurite resistance protein